MAFTAEAFNRIRRKGSGVPYITHLLSVAALVGEGGGDEDQMIAALLHDYLEDVEGSSRDILVGRYGERVARLVEALSDTTVRPKPPWRERKERYLAHLRHEDAEVKLISCADKLHNVRTIVRDHRTMGDEIFERFNAKKHGTIWYYESLVPALKHDWDHWLLEELETEVDALMLAARGLTP